MADFRRLAPGGLKSVWDICKIQSLTKLKLLCPEAL